MKGWLIETGRTAVLLLAFLGGCVVITGREVTGEHQPRWTGLIFVAVAIALAVLIARADRKEGER